ncbi:MAG: hypothetical protein ABIQ87_03785, partial [Rubrivivax sp.]
MNPPPIIAGSTAAVVVVYKDIRHIATTLALLRAQLRTVVLVDNAEQPHTGLDALADPATAAVSPAYRDRATAMRGRYMGLARWRFGFHPREFSELRDVAFVINSMAVWR